MYSFFFLVEKLGDLMAIGDDFAIDYVNKRIYHSAGTTVYLVNALYSWLMDEFDEQGAMDDDIPMSAQTPNAYTIINNWFINDESCEFLKEGAITQTRDNAKFALLTFQESGYTNCVASDITKQVVWDASEHGALLAYNNTTRKWWVRTADTFTPSKAITITGGTGAGTATGFDNTGEDLFANIYTLGTIETGTDIYIYQAGAKISAWWSSGHIDILLKTKEFGTEIDEGKIVVYARVYTDLYDFFEIDLTVGGRNAVPLATSDDLDNQTAVATVLNYMDTLRIMFVGGTIPYDTKTGDDPVKHMVIRGGTSNATAFILNAPSGASGTFTLANIVGTFQSAEVIEICEELKFDTQTTLFTTLGQTITGGTSGATGVLRRVTQDSQEAGNEGILFLTGVTGTFVDGETLTGSANGSATSNGTVTANTFSANTTAAVTFAATTTRDLDNGAGAQPYNVIIDLNSLTVTVLYEFVKALNRRTSTLQTFPTNGTDTRYAYNGEFYQKANMTYPQIKKASPFGTFAGGKFFGARGIWIENMASADVEKFSLIDANNATQNPPTFSTIKVVAMIATNDRVLVCESTGGGATVIKKNQYTNVAQSIGVDYVTISGSIADDAPSTGVVRVVYNYGLGTEGEDIYSYTSIDRSGADDKFMISGTTARAYSTGDRTYNPYIDTTADANGEREVIVKYSGATKYIVTRVRRKAYIPFQVAGSFGSGLTTVTAIRTADGIYQP